jgi:hypothetical protein
MRRTTPTAVMVRQILRRRRPVRKATTVAKLAAARTRAIAAALAQAGHLNGRVGDWRAGLGRSSCSLLARSFVCECHTISTMPRFQPPPRRTQRADFPHYAPPFASCQGLWDLSCWGDFRLCLIHRSQPRPFCS